MRAWTLKKMREYLGAEEPTLTGDSYLGPYLGPYLAPI